MLPILQHMWSGRCFYLAGQKHANAPVYGTKTLAGFAEEGDPLRWHSGCKRSSAALLKIDFSLHQLILKCFKRRDSLGAEIKARRGAGAGFNASSLLALRSCTFCLFHLFWDLSWKRQWETSALRAREGNSSQGKGELRFLPQPHFCLLKTLWHRGVSIGFVHSQLMNNK